MTQLHAPETWFVSDLHFGDESIIPVCRTQFTSIDEMDALLIQQWQRRVHFNDMVVVLGDFTGSSPTSRERGLAYLDVLPGRKFLVPGNHDPMHGHEPGSAGWAAATDTYLDAGFTGVLHTPGPARTTFHGQDWAFTLCHFPCQPAYFETPDRYARFRPADQGGLVIHGHVHDAWKVLPTPAGTIQVNVSPETSSYAPSSLEEVLSLVENAQGALLRDAAPGSALPVGTDVCRVGT